MNLRLSEFVMVQFLKSLESHFTITEFGALSVLLRCVAFSCVQELLPEMFTFYFSIVQGSGNGITVVCLHGIGLHMVEERCLIRTGTTICRYEGQSFMMLQVELLYKWNKRLSNLAIMNSYFYLTPRVYCVYQPSLLFYLPYQSSFPQPRLPQAYLKA